MPDSPVVGVWLKGHYESFVIRIWVTERGAGRGELVDVSSGEVIRFTDLNRMADLIVHRIADRTGAPDDGRDDGDGGPDAGPRRSDSPQDA